MGSLPLAALVATDGVEAALSAFRASGAYDASRRVTAHDESTVAIPVHHPPGDPFFYEALIVQSEPERRLSDLDSHLRDRGFSEAAIERAPHSWGVIGDVILVEFPPDCVRRETIAEALLEIHGNAQTVLARGEIDGPYREPAVSVVAGEGRTETVHREHGIAYALDLATVMFSPGNKAERARMRRVASPGEQIFDMFAGVGYFSLPMAAGGARVTAAEVNPAAFGFLLENATRNGVRDRLSPHLADCRTVRTDADRVVMGHYDAPDYLEAAMDALRPGGTLHCHAAVREDRRDEPVMRLHDLVAGRNRTVEQTDLRTVKTTGERWEHVVLDAQIA